MKLDIYEIKRKQLKESLQQLGDIAHDLMLNVQEENAKKAIDMLYQEQFNMVVVGEFSRGKSTFVNALLGQNILPSSKSPTTAIISKITYGEQPEFTLHYKNDLSPKQVSQEEFSGLKAPKEGIMGGIKDGIASIKEKIFHEQNLLDGIAYASIKYPLAFCRDQVELVDTPGTNDLNTGRIEITYRYLEETDALIMLLAADQALSDSEVNFLKERILKNKIQDIFFVINRKDTLHGPEEERQVLDFVRTNLMNLLPDDMKDNLKVFLVSSRQALLYRRAESGEVLKTKQLKDKPDNMEITGFVDLEESLGRFFSEEKGKAKLEKYVRIGQEILNDISKTLALRQEMSAHSADEIREKAAVLEPQFLETKHKSAKIIGNLQTNLTTAENQLENSCIFAAERLRKSAIDAVENYSGEMNSSDIKVAVERAVTPEQKRWIEEMRKYQRDLIAVEVEKTEKALQKIWTDVSGICSFNKYVVNGNDYNMFFEVDNVSEHKVSKGQENVGSWCIGGAIGLVLGAHLFLPALALGAIGAGLLGFFSDSREDIRDRVKQQISEQYNQQSETIRADIIDEYRNRVKEVCDELQSAIDNRIKDMHNQLKIVLKKKEEQEQTASNENRSLIEQMQHLEKCKRQLMAIID